MSRTSTKIAATGTVAALGALGASALSAGGARSSTTAAAPAPAAARVEVRTVVIKKTVHRTRRIKAAAPPATPPASIAPSRAVASPSAAPPASAAPPVAAAPSQLAPVAYATAGRKPPRVRSRTSGTGRRAGSAAYGEDGSEGRDRTERGDD